MNQDNRNNSPRSPVAEPTVSTDLAKLAEAALVDLPLAGIKRIAGAGTQRELQEAGWKTYDATVSLANSAINSLYTNDSFGRFAGRLIEFSLQVQRLQAAMAGAFFATLWPAIGLPTANEIESLRDDMRAMRDEFRAARAEHENESEQFEGIAVADSVMPKPVWEKWTLSETREVKPDVGN